MVLSDEAVASSLTSDSCVKQSKAQRQSKAYQSSAQDKGPSMTRASPLLILTISSIREKPCWSPCSLTARHTAKRKPAKSDGIPLSDCHSRSQQEIFEISPWATASSTCWLPSHCLQRVALQRVADRVTYPIIVELPLFLQPLLQPSIPVAEAGSADLL